MKVLLLAAGRSQRCKPIEDKNFIQFCGKPLIEHQLSALQKAGFYEFIVIGGAHNLEQLKAWAKNHPSPSKRFQLEIVEQENLDDGMAGAVMSARPHVKKDDQLLIVSTNDIVDDKAYKLIFDAAQNDYFDSCILGKRVKDYFPGGYLKVNSQWQIQSIIEKPGKGKEPSDLVNLVLHLHKNPEMLYKYLEKVQSDRDDRYEVALDNMIQKGLKMQAIPYDGYWQPIKFPWHVFDVANHFLSQLEPHIASTASVGERVTLKGTVVVEEDVKIFDGATVIGPTYLGKGSVVATNALVRESILGERCVIGYNAEVARSVLGDDVWTHSNYIGDSFIGNDVSFGAGAITGNLRFDEGDIKVTMGGEKVASGRNKLGIITGNRIRVAINTSFMPGVKIGSDSLIGAGLVIDRDIPEGSFVNGKFDLEIKPNQAKTQLPSRDVLRKKL